MANVTFVIQSGRFDAPAGTVFGPWQATVTPKNGGPAISATSPAGLTV